MALHVEACSFHPGELAMQRLLHVPPMNNPNAAGLGARYIPRVIASPLVAVGVLDPDGRPWTTILGGEAGFAQPLDHDVVRSLDDIPPSLLGGGQFRASSPAVRPDVYMHSLVSLRDDPVVRALLDLDGRPPVRGDKLMSALSIDLATRDRVKLMGRLAAGGVDDAEGKPGRLLAEGVAGVHLLMNVQESLGNCPKYLNKKAIRPHAPSPRPFPPGDMLPLPQAALDLLGRADLFFMSSTDGESMDTNHRGGPPGLVRVVTNNNDDDDAEDGGVSVVYPEYSGNRLYQTLGNLHVRPRVGLCVPDFSTGDVLYLSGEARILVGDESARLLPRTKLAVRMRVEAARLVRDGLPFRGDVVDYSPYNPPVRRLAAEITHLGETGGGGGDGKARAAVVLVGREVLTPTIARFTFRLEAGAGAAGRTTTPWVPGQHVTLDFGPELDVGWTHMREDDPASLNDDYVRTFTVSNAPPTPTPPPEEEEQQHKGPVEVQITARRNGPVTGLLWRWNLRAPLEVGVLGFGGGESFRIPRGVDDAEGGADGKEKKAVRRRVDPVFVAGGVGITPLLAQAPGLLAGAGSKARLRVLWSLKGEDLPFAADEFARIPGLAGVTRVFVTGGGAEESVVRRLEEHGCAEVAVRRMSRGDVVGGDGPGDGDGDGEDRRYYLCTGPGMMKVLLGWLSGKDVVYESFEY